MEKRNERLKWVAINIPAMIAFAYGGANDMASLTIAASMVFWYSALTGLHSYYNLEAKAKKFVAQAKERVLTEPAQGLMDLTMIGLTAYHGHYVLAPALALGMVGTKLLWDKVAIIKQDAINSGSEREKEMDELKKEKGTKEVKKATKKEA